MVDDDGGAEGRGTSPEARRRERRHLLLVGAITAVGVVGGLVGGVAAVLVAEGAPADAVPWWLVPVLVVPMLVLWAAALAFVWWRRRRGSPMFRTSPLWELGHRRERSALVKALRRGDDIAPEHRELALRVARDLTGRRNLAWLYVAVAVVFAANAVIQEGPVLRWLMVAVAVLNLALVAYVRWLVGRMRRAQERLTAA